MAESRDAAEPLDETELAIEGALRPTSLGEFVGQPKVRGQLQLLLDAARIQERPADHILLAGGSAPLPGLTEAVTQQTGFACTVVNPFDGMEIGSTVRLKKMVREAPSYLTSCGLAMRRFFQ